MNTRNEYLRARALFRQGRIKEAAVIARQILDWFDENGITFGLYWDVDCDDPLNEVPNTIFDCRVIVQVAGENR